MKKVAIQGIKGSFHEVAALQYFGEEIEIVECKTFRSVCEQIDKDNVDFAVMAIENSLAASILDNYMLIREFHLKIIGEVYIHIRMNLMTLPQVSKDDIKIIYSHPMAFNQCSSYVDYQFPNVERIQNQDTASSGKLIRDLNLRDAAAIGNSRTAELYELEIHDAGIETDKRNYTRFLILSKRSIMNENSNKASLSFKVGHFHGALAQVLNTFAFYKINLTKIQSIPVIARPNEYSIFVDIEWDLMENYDKAIHQVLKNVSSLAILGEYERGEAAIYNQ